jgi:hypothetical protein
MTNLPVKLPPGYSPVVQEGQSVAIGQAIAQKIIKEQETINIAKAFSLPLSKATKTLKKFPGDQVKIGDILAVKKSFLGMDKEALVSKCEGVVLSYERGSGELVIRTGEQAETKELFSPVAGTVTMCNNEKIVIATDKDVVAADGGWGETAEGEVFVLQSSFASGDAELTIDSIAFQLDSRAIGKVVIAKKVNKDFLLKGIGIGAKSVIAIDIPEEDLSYVASKKFETPILSVNGESVSQLLSWEGRKVFVDGKAKAVILLQI